MRKYDYLIEEKKTLNESFNRLVDIIKVLRVECPWDREQTHQSLIPCLKEEAYETIDAIQENNDENLKEELGDVLLQVVFHGIIANETSKFTLVDIINAECEKMIRRHPHVFSENEDKTIDKVLETWEDIKCKEHKVGSQTNRLYSVPNALPALIKSLKIQKKAAESGFDWESIDGSINKIDEETEELKIAIKANDITNIEEELGDLLFTIVNASRFLKVDPEEALIKTTDKFIRRFEFIEDNSNKEMTELTLEEMDMLWNKAKQNGL